MEKQGTFSHFLYSAIIIEKKDLSLAFEMQKRLSKDYFQGKNIKSSNISRDSKGFSKRLKILKDLLKLKFVVSSLVINKKKIDSEGLSYKTVFYKYFSKTFVTQFLGYYTSYKIIADKLGEQKFQESLSQFINTNCIQRDLFHPDRVYILADDKTEEPLLQLADFISGCLGLVFCDSHIHPDSSELLELLHSRTFIEFFPYETTEIVGSITKDDKQVNQEIGRIATDSAIRLLEGQVSKEAEEILKYLLLVYKVDPDRLVESYDILDKIQMTSPEYTTDNVRQNIQELRDKGALICSIQGKSGYKIPNKVQDVVGFYNRYLGSIIPMLQRISISEKALKMNSVNSIDILTVDNNLELLNKLLQVYLYTQKIN